MRLCPFFFFSFWIICVIHQPVGRQAWSKPGIQELSEALPSAGRSALPIKQRMLASKGQQTLLCPVGSTPPVNFPAMSGVSNVQKGWGLPPPRLPTGLTRGRGGHCPPCCDPQPHLCVTGRCTPGCRGDQHAAPAVPGERGQSKSTLHPYLGALGVGGPGGSCRCPG